jgi:hypothetical protein
MANPGTRPSHTTKLKTLAKNLLFRLLCKTGHTAVLIDYKDQRGKESLRWVRPIRPEYKYERCRVCRYTHKGPLKFVCYCESRQAERQFFAAQLKVKKLAWRHRQSKPTC